MKKHYKSLLRSALLSACSVGAFIGFAQSAQISADVFELEDNYTMPTGSSASATESCTITNIQGAIASGTLSIFATALAGVHTYFNPDGSAGPADPGCSLDQPYPFNITNVQLNPFAAGGFGIPAAEGVGTMVYRVLIVEAVDNAGCNEVGATLFTSPDLTIEVIATSNQYPQTIPVGIDVNAGFFVFVQTVSWSGAANRSPSMVLWNNGVTGTPIPACRQYVASFDVDGNAILTDFPAFFATAPGWTNVVVNGEAPDIVGDIDIAVSNVDGPAEYTAGFGATVTADLSNIGDASVPSVEATLTANGVTVGTQTVAVAAGATVEVSFAYNPAAAGAVTLVVSTDVAGDVDANNNSASLDITVLAPADPCIFSDDIESYTAGGVSPQDAQWALWTPGAPASDGFVSTEQALSGTQSVRTDGATDLLYLLGNQAGGAWKYTHNLYIPAGNGGYFNVQKTQTPGQQFAVEVVLANTGIASVNAGTVGAATFNYPQGEWVEFSLIIDIENDLANLNMNGVLMHQWPYSWQANSTAAGGLTTIGAINYFPTGGTLPLMYIDDITFCQYDNGNGPCEAFGLVEGVAVVGDNTGATPFNPDLAADGAGCWAEQTLTINGDVWFQFTAPTDGNYQVTTALDELTNDDTQLLIYTTSDNTCSGELNLVGCNDDVSGAVFLSSAIVEGLTAGTTIYILVDGWNGTEGTFQIAVFNASPPANNLCPDAADLTALTAGNPGDTNTSTIFTNVNATVGDGVLPTCFEDGGTGALASTTWYTFTGNGNTYYIFTNDCNGTATDYIDFGDTQMAIFEGDCGALTEVGCNEDIDFDNDDYASGVELETVAGTQYTIMIDGFGTASGEFCISFENMGNPDGIEELAKYGVKMFPNPAAEFVRIQADANMTNMIVLNSVGQLVDQLNNRAGTDVLIDVSSYAKGLYFVQMTIDGNVLTQKLNVQ